MPATPSDPAPGPNSFSTHLGPLLLLTAIFFLSFLARIILAPLLPTIEADLGIGHGQAGSLFLLISIGYFLTLLASGHLSSRLLHRRTILISAAATSMALFFTAFSQGLWGMRTGLLLLGMAGGLYLPSGIATISAMVPPRHWGKALAIHELAPNMSFVAAPFLSEALLHFLPWRGILGLLGVLSLLAALAFASHGKEADFAGKAPSLRAFKTLFGVPAFWIMMALFSLGISATLGIYTMLPLYLVIQVGLGQDLANGLIGLSRVFSLGAALLAGWASDRLGPGLTLRMVFLSTGLATVCLGFLPGLWVLVFVFLQPLLAVCFFPPGFAALSSIGPANTRNVAVSLTVPTAFIIGGGIIPVLIGIMGDRGDFGFGITVVGGLIILGAALATALKLEKRD